MGLRTASLLGAATLLAAIGCTRPRTEVIVITDTNLSVPDEVDELFIEVTAPDGETQTSVAYLQVPGSAPPPRSIGLVHDGGALGPFRVRAVARLNDVEVLERVAAFRFQPERTLVLRMDLDRECVGVDCGAEETCAGGDCRPQRIEPQELEPWDGVIPMADGGVPPIADAGPQPDAGPQADGGDCTAEACNEADDDCDMMVDEDFDLTTDAANCGACGNACAADESCVGSACVPGGCEAGTADCNADPADGCETTLGTDSDCGSCGDRCVGGRMCCPSGMCARTCP